MPRPKLRHPLLYLFWFHARGQLSAGSCHYATGIREFHRAQRLPQWGTNAMQSS
jgi:hypothetical protein